MIRTLWMLGSAFFILLPIFIIICELFKIIKWNLE